MPIVRQQFLSPSGTPLAGGFVYTYNAGTTTPAPTYSDSTGLYPNQNPIPLDAGGFATIWLGPQSYRIVVQDSNGVQQYMVDNVSDVGQILYLHSVVTNPANGAQQTVAGPLGATYFVGTTAHTTSPGVRVSLLDPSTALDTANPPSIVTTPPANAGQVYTVPDPSSAQANFVMSPGPDDWQASHAYTAGMVIQPILNNPCSFQFTVSTAGTSASAEPIFSTAPCTSSASSVVDASVTWGSLGAVAQTNKLDCTQPGITCVRNAYVYFEGGGCNNTTSALGWDTFPTNAPTPNCVTGTNLTKGVLGFPGAANIMQQNTGTAAAALTVTTTYGAATLANDFLEAEIIVDGSKTVSGCTDGTNAYTKATNVTNGAYDLEIWYYNGGAAAMAANSTLTCTLSGTANAAINWKEYSGIATSSPLDKTATNTGTGTAVTSGTTTGTTQNTELVLGVVGVGSTPAVTTESGWVAHTLAAQSTNVEVQSQGIIQQLAAAQSSTFTLGASGTWASAVATFKVNVGATTTAQRSWGLPSFYVSSQPVNSTIKWQLGSLSSVTGTAKIGAAIVCTPDGSTDDSPFNAATVSTISTAQPSLNLVTTTPLNSLVSTGCAPSNLMHYEIQRLRYDPADTFEGWVYVVGASLQFGINQ